MRFSQRIGLRPIKSIIQKDSMDEDLRNGLWNAFQVAVLDVLDGHCDWISGSPYEQLFRKLWSDFFKYPLDTLNDHWKTTRERIRKGYFEVKWYDVYDFIEFIAQNLSGPEKEIFVGICNSDLEKELSAYRFIGDNIGEITSEAEISAIEAALADSSPFTGINGHLQSALKKFTDRKNPDYRNSIKESISAVEGMARLITGDPKATLGKAIKRLKDNGLVLHPALEDAWSKLYGYTSDAGGIRHAMLKESTIRSSDAKYMLVSCSAFVSYLLELSREAGLKLR